MSDVKKQPETVLRLPAAPVGKLSGNRRNQEIQPEVSTLNLYR